MAANIICVYKAFKPFEITKTLYQKRQPPRILNPVVQRDVIDVKENYKDIVPFNNSMIALPDLSPLEGPKIIVSDAHLCDRSRANDFGGARKKEKYLQLIESARRLGATWIDLGDRFELWQAKLGDIILNNQEILTALAGLQRVIYILGNHDRSLSPWLLDHRLGNTTFLEYLYDPTSNSFFTHGNIEWENSHASNFGYYLTRIGGLCERLISRRFDEVAEQWWKKITPTSRLYRENKPYFVDWVSILTDRLKKQQYGSDKPFKLFFGHTHAPSTYESSDRGKILNVKLGPYYQYWNAGCWVGGHTDYIFIDEKGRIDLRKA